MVQKNKERMLLAVRVPEVEPPLQRLKTSGMSLSGRKLRINSAYNFFVFFGIHELHHLVGYQEV